MAYTWTAGAITLGAWKSIAYGAGTLLAIAGSSNAANGSTDHGLTWTAKTLPNIRDWSDICFNGTVFCAVSKASNASATTSDAGTTWTNRPMPAYGNWQRIAAGKDGRLITFLTSNDDVAISTDNGVAWTSALLPDIRAWTGIATNGKVWVISSSHDGIGNPSTQFAISRDKGLTWAFVTVPVGTWVSLACNGEGFVAVGNGNKCLTSSTGDAWTEQTMPSTANWSIVKNTTEGGYIAIAQSTTSAAESANNGATWTASTLSSADNWQGAAHSGLRVVVVAESVTATSYSNASAIAAHLVHNNESIVKNSTSTELMAYTQVQADSIALTTQLVVEAITFIREALSLSDPLLTTAKLTATVIELLNLDARLAATLEALINDNALFVSVENGVVSKSVALLDALILSSEANTTINAMAIVSEAVVIRSILTLIKEGVITDAMTLADTLDSKLIAFENLIANLLLTDSAQTTAIISVLVNDSLELDDQLNLRTIQNASISEEIAFSVSFSFAGEAYFGVCMNARTKGITEFTNYNFNSMANFNGVLYGVTETGLYELTGDSDNGSPINARLKTFFSRIAGGKHTRVDGAYLGYKSNGALQLKVIASEGGTKKAYIYDLAASNGNTFKPGRIKIGRGIKSVYFAFELSNVNGADFDLDVIEVHPLVLTRRIP